MNSAYGLLPDRKVSVNGTLTNENDESIFSIGLPDPILLVERIDQVWFGQRLICTEKEHWDVICKRFVEPTHGCKTRRNDTDRRNVVCMLGGPYVCPVCRWLRGGKDHQSSKMNFQERTLELLAVARSKDQWTNSQRLATRVDLRTLLRLNQEDWNSLEKQDLRGMQLSN